MSAKQVVFSKDRGYLEVMMETYVHLISDGIEDGDGVVLDGDRAPKSPWSNCGPVERHSQGASGKWPRWRDDTLGTAK